MWVSRTIPDHAWNLVQFGAVMIRELKRFNRMHGSDLHIKIGISTGTVVFNYFTFHLT